VGKYVPTTRTQVEPELTIMQGPVTPCPDFSAGRLQTELNYNEYCVYDVGQVKIRYIVRVRFKFV